MRKLTVGEKAAVRLLAERIGDAEMREQLSRDIETVMVEEQAPDGSRLIFHIDRFERGPYRGQESYRGDDGFTVEGMLMDIDGAAVEVYLYHANGRIFELELLRPDTGRISEPRWETFRVK